MANSTPKRRDTVFMGYPTSDSPLISLGALGCIGGSRATHKIFV